MEKKEKEELDKIPKMNETEKCLLREALLKNKAVQLYGEPDYADHFVPPLLPVRLSSIFKPSLHGKPIEEVRAEAKDIFEDIMPLTEKQAADVEILTRNQRDNRAWKEIRAGLCTGSVSHLITRVRDIDNPPKSLIKKICFPAKSYANVPALRLATNVFFIFFNNN